MNIRFSTLFFIFLFMMAALGLYGVKYKVQTIREQVAEVTRDLKQERTALKVTQAEWTYLNRPQRLQQLAQKHLKLAPMTGAQMSNVASLPMNNPELNVADAATAAPAKMASNYRPAQPRAGMVPAGIVPASAVMEGHADAE